MKYIVYKTTNLVNDKIYIGVHKTKDPEKFDGYIGCGVIITTPSSYENPYTPFQKAVKLYGTHSFKRDILFIYDTAEEAFQKEAEIVDYNFVKRRDTYNVALGGGGGNQAPITVYQFSLGGNLIAEHSSMIEACEEVGVTHFAIYRAIYEKGSGRGFFWSTSDTIDITEYVCGKGTPVYKYDLDGTWLDSYSTFAEAAKANECYLQTMERCVHGGYSQKGYYYSTELVDQFVPPKKLSLRNKSLYVYTLEGDYVTSLFTQEEICKFFNVKNTYGVTTAMRCGRTYKGWQLSLEKQDKIEAVLDKRNKSRITEVYTEDGTFVKEFPSITQAVYEYGTGVLHCARGVQPSYKGYIFKFKS